jgi:PadR family transcriptional regulator PadR
MDHAEKYEPDPDATEAPGQDPLARKFQKELNAGLVALVLLAILDRAEEDLYGYQIAKRLQREGGAGALVKQGALYPVLRTLSAAGLLASRVVPSYSGPPRRYYRITGTGRTTFQQWRAIWCDTRDLVNDFTDPTGART